MVVSKGVVVVISRKPFILADSWRVLVFYVYMLSRIITSNSSSFFLIIIKRMLGMSRASPNSALLSQISFTSQLSG